MADYIKIDKNEVLYVREEIVKKVGIESFVANIEKSMGVDTGILPRNCLFMRQSGERCAYLIEVPAGLVPVSFKDERNNVINYMISIPFTQFYVVCNPVANTILSIFMSVTKTPLISIDQTVFIAPYLNIFGQGTSNVCTGSMQIPQNVPLNMKVNATVSTFFEADFNADLTPTTFGKINWTNAKDYITKWARLTTKDRFFACAPDTEYKEHELTPIKIIERALGE